jgi:putative transposase
LRNLAIDRANLVWSTDSTFVRMRRGLLYLVAIFDGLSRYVVSWDRSTTLDGAFCLLALEQALAQAQPEICTTDQGAQFTSLAFTGRFAKAGIRSSWDGRGRALDKVFVERLWRSVKEEESSLTDDETGADALSGLGRSFRFYNHERLHQARGYRTPAQVYGVA